MRLKFMVSFSVLFNFKFKYVIEQLQQDFNDSKKAWVTDKKRFVWLTALQIISISQITLEKHWSGHLNENNNIVQ